MRQIPVYKSQRASSDIVGYASVDDEDYDLVKDTHWFMDKDGYAIHVIHVAGRVSRTLRMHRVILGLQDRVSGLSLNSDHVDHDDNNKTNNVKTNIKQCTQKQNQTRRRKQRKPASSRFKGVSFHRMSGKWQVAIEPDGKKIFLGSFENEEDAAAAYNTAAMEYFGEYALLNDI